MLQQLLEIVSLDVEETIEKIMKSQKAGQQLLAMLAVLKDFDDNPGYKSKTAA